MAPTQHILCSLVGLHRLERDDMAGGAFTLMYCCSVLFGLWTRFRYCLHNFLLTYDICFELISPRLTNLAEVSEVRLGFGSDWIWIWLASVLDARYRVYGPG